MNFLLTPLIFFIWRIFDFLIIFFSQKIIPYLGFFPYKDKLPGFNLPRWISSLANFDGLHYISIARQGYDQFEQAFFPLYPFLIKFLTSLFFNNQLLTGLIISNVSFFLGLIIFYKYLRLNHLQPFITILLLLAFPTSFFFGAVYTEGLFFLLIVSTLYFLKKESYFFMVIFAFLASLTRLVGIFLIVPILFHIIYKYQKLEIKNQNDKLNIKHIFYFLTSRSYFLIIFAPILGLTLYCFYLFKTTGDPFFFFSSQPAFGANRSTHLISLPQVYWRYFKIFFTANWDFRYFVSVLEFTIFSLVFVILILDLFKNLTLSKVGKNYDLLGLNLFSLINIVLPTLTGTFLSIPRFSLMSLSFFIYISQIKNTVVKYLIMGIFLILHILLLGYFNQGYFIS